MKEFIMENDDTLTTDTYTISGIYDVDDEWHVDLDALTSITISDPNISTPIDINDLDQRLKNIENRLSILVPDPKMLEQYETLKSLYDQYKTAEGLLKGNSTLDPKV